MMAGTVAMALVKAFEEDAVDTIARDAARIVRGSGIIAMPTDSVYALGACAFDEAAVRRVCTIKRERAHKPILALIADRSQLDALVGRVPPAATVLMDQFWPGPLTIVFPASPHLPAALTAGTGTIGVRLPAHPLLGKLLQATGPLTGTSANRSGAAPARTAREVEDGLGREVDLILDGGPASTLLPSTVIAVTETVRVLREGPIERTTVKAVLARAGIELA
jgi:L-threonylcarbamoyladenylate synthase